MKAIKPSDSHRNGQSSEVVNICDIDLTGPALFSPLMTQAWVQLMPNNDQIHL